LMKRESQEREERRPQTFSTVKCIIRDFVEAVEKREVEKTLYFLAEDAVWVAPEGTFKGKEKLKRFITWSFQTGWVKMRDAGNGIIVKGNEAVYEYIFEGGTPDGRKWREIPG